MERTPEIRIFKPGDFTSAEGTKVSFTQADLEAAAAAYDPEKDPAPIVVGHPAMDAPAFGWVGGLKVVDDHLVAVPDRIEPSFAEAVRDGRYRKVSAQFYPPQHPGNPKPGSFYLKHVGFLGAAAPAVKGLGTVAFAADDAAQPVATTEQTIEETIVAERTNDTTSFAEREAELLRREQALTTRETAIVGREKIVGDTLHAANVSFADGLVAAGSLAPAGKDLVVGILDQLEATATVSFGEALGQLAPAAAFKKLLEGGTPLVSFGELARPEAKDPDKPGVISFAAPSGHEVDPARLEIHRKALDLQAANPNLSYIDAVKRAGG